MRNRLLFAAAAGFALLLSACKKDLQFPGPTAQDEIENTQFLAVQSALDINQQALDYGIVLPNGKKAVGSAIKNNLAELGRVLFYDKTLSKDGKISCASCHKQELAFADDQARSVGIMGRLTERNSFALLGRLATFTSNPGTNLYTMGSGGELPTAFPLFWDERAKSIAEQSRETFANPLEMGMEMHEVVEAAAARDYYPWLFQRAFGSADITEQKVLNAIAEFVRAIPSTGSKLDQAMAALALNQTFADFKGLTFNSFSPAENLGKLLFEQNCEGCHGSVNSPAVVSAAHNGLAITDGDQGKGQHTGQPQDMGVFKVPVLRNVSVTGPYMHDGRFKTLDEVLEHYSTGISEHPNLHPLLRRADQSPRNMQFSAEEKAAIKAFLLTMTDEQILTDLRYSDPFK
jgi:cytochrome c peroxidase